MNIPESKIFDGETLAIALSKYDRTINEMFLAYKSRGIILRVHTIQIVPPARVVCFIDINEGLTNQLKAMDLIKSQLGDIGNAGCQHDWNESLVCNKCGAKM